MVAIATDRLTKVFDGGTVAVDEVSIEVASGEFLVLLGPTGCGKSTILRLVAGLEQPTDGHVLIDGEVGRPRGTGAAGGDGVPGLRALPAPHRRAEHRVPAADRGAAGRGARRARRRGRRVSRHHRPAAPPARPPVRRAAPAGGDGAGDRPPAAGLPARRTAVQPRRRPACRASFRGGRALPPPRRHDAVRHPRPDRGDDDGRPRRGAAPGAAPADGPPAEVYGDPATLFVAAFLGHAAPNLLQGAVYVTEASRGARPRLAGAGSSRDATGPGRWPATTPNG